MQTEMFDVIMNDLYKSVISQSPQVLSSAECMVSCALFTLLNNDICECIYVCILHVCTCSYILRVHVS